MAIRQVVYFICSSILILISFWRKQKIVDNQNNHENRTRHSFTISLIHVENGSCLSAVLRNLQFSSLWRLRKTALTVHNFPFWPRKVATNIHLKWHSSDILGLMIQHQFAYHISDIWRVKQEKNLKCKHKHRKGKQ